MFRPAALARYWLPPILLMTLIFWGSTDALSERRTSRIIGPLLRWFMPDVRDETIAGIQAVIRKGGHITEYGVLCLLFWRAIYRPTLANRRPWDRRAAWVAWGLAFLYACSDEYHQSFVASRDGSPRDVGFDMVGASAALLVLWWVGRRFGWFTSNAAGSGVLSPRSE